MEGRQRETRDGNWVVLKQNLLAANHLWRGDTGCGVAGLASALDSRILSGCARPWYRSHNLWPGSRFRGRHCSDARALTKPSTALVTDGIYRWTRNPMYVGLSLILVGIGLATGSVWFLVALPFAVFAVTKLAIEREELYLADKFGAAYHDYKARVRRWF